MPCTWPAHLNLSTCSTVCYARAGSDHLSVIPLRVLSTPVCISAHTGAYSNLVKLQMQRQQVEEDTEAEVQEVMAAGKPVTRHSLERVLSR